LRAIFLFFGDILRVVPSFFKGELGGDFPTVALLTPNFSQFDDNQLRLWLSSFAYVLLNACRQTLLEDTELENARVGTICTQLLKDSLLADAKLFTSEPINPIFLLLPNCW
jgi:hypothetical protein